ncbi:YncE family protein [Paenarthrobacter sp. NPDC089989]|uniref:YncE family protein n=1 Tax=unclassified Paenarthrobacter TaxID=2634190 RepID=UPI0038218CF4
MDEQFLVVADQKAGRVTVLDPASGNVVRKVHGVVLAEHAGILDLGGGMCAFIDDAGGALVIFNPLTEAPPLHLPVAIPGEHLACDPSGRYLAVTTGLGLSWEPWSDLLTVVDLESDDGPTSRRVRTRAGEPGVVVGETPDGPVVVVRHREPGSIESFSIGCILEEGIHCPPMSGLSVPASPDGHGDAFDPATGTMFVATGLGLERFDVRKPQPHVLPTIPWGAEGRAYFLRFCPVRRILVAVLRAGGEEPREWTAWTNALWVHHLDTGVTSTAPLGPGLVFRFALTATGIATARIHPDGDQLTVHGLDPQTSLLRELRAQWDLPPMNGAPRPGSEPWDNAERRAIAASPTSEVVAVTRGGHGELHLLDTSRAGNAVRTLSLETPLHDGGHLAWLSSEQQLPRDTVGR